MRTRGSVAATVSATACGAALALLGPARPAHACTFQAPTPFVVDTAQQAIDTMPPGRVGVPIISLQRGQLIDGDPNDCLSYGQISFELAPTPDDHTTPDRMGYGFQLAAGAAPQLDLPDVMVLPPQENPAQFEFHWLDARPDLPFDLTIGITPIDLAGNRGPTTPVEFRDQGNGLGPPPVDTGNPQPAACAIGAGGSRGAAAPWTVLVTGALALVIARRRRAR